MAALLFSGLMSAPFAPQVVSSERAFASAPDRVELVGRRTARSKTFRNGDGTYTTVLYAAPIHFRTAGEWQAIDTSLVRANDPAFGFESRANSFRTRFKERLGDSFMRLDIAGESITQTLDGSHASTAEATSSRLTYREALPGVDLRYDLGAEGAKETLVLKDPSAASSFRFRLSADAGERLRAWKRADGSWAVGVVGQAEPLFFLAAPFATETANGTPASASRLGEPSDRVKPVGGTTPEESKRAIPAHANMTVRPAGEDLLVELSVDPVWLNDPQRRFPVLLDPTIEINRDASDASFKTSCPTCRPALDNHLLIGTDSGNVWRSALRFELSEIPAGAEVSGAALRLYFDSWCIRSSGSCDPGPHNLKLYRLTQPWSTESTSSELAFDPAELASFQLPAGAWPSRQWMVWQDAKLTAAVTDWLYDRAPNLGLLLKRADAEESDPNGSGPYPPSSRYQEPTLRPRLEITYAGGGVKLNQPTLLHSNGAELSWTRYSLPGAPFERYEVHRSSAPGFTPTRATRLETYTNVDTLSHVDTKAAPGKTFTYKVVANGYESNEQTVTLPADGRARRVLQPDAIAGKATYINFNSGSTDCNVRGNTVQLWVGTTATEKRRVLARFDLQQIPAGATIYLGSLGLWRGQHVGGAPSPLLRLHRITNSWQEGAQGGCNGSGATWYERQGGVPWTTQGGDYDPAVAASLTNPAWTPPGWDSFEITGLVQQWHTNPTTNEGALLRLDDETLLPDRTWSYMSDDFTPAATLRPKLTVEYGDGSNAVEPTVTLTSPSGGTVSGTTTLAASSSDDRRVEKVDFLVDNKLVGVDRSAPYELSWDSRKVANGPHTITAKATDDAGNLSDPSSTSVTVANSAPPTTNVQVVQVAPYAQVIQADRPRAYWRLSDADGSATAIDESGNTLNGTYGTRVTRVSPGAIAADSNRAANVAGVTDTVPDDQVTVTDNNLLDFGTSDFSVEAWVKTSQHGEATIVGKYGAVAPRWRLTVTNDVGFEGRARIRIEQVSPLVTTTLYSAGRIDDGAWHHVAAVFERTKQLRLYVDGQLRTAAVATTGDVSNAADLQIGGESDGDAAFVGQLDEVALYPRGLTSERVRAHHRAGIGGLRSAYRQEVLASGPDSYFRLGEAKGTGWARDFSGHSLHAMYEPSVTPGEPGALVNDADTAALFEGVDPDDKEEEVEIRDTPLLDFGTSDFTVEGWIKTGQINDGTIVSKCCFQDEPNPRHPYWRLSLTDDTGFAGRIRAKIDDGSGSLTAYGPALVVNNNAWHHVAAVFDRDWGIRLYVDGHEAATMGRKEGDVSNSADFEIGGADGEDFFVGTIDEVALYPRALPASAIQAHHDNGRTGSGYDEFVLSDGPRGYWRFGDPADWTKARDQTGTRTNVRYQGPTTGIDGIFAAGDGDTAARFLGEGEQHVDLGDVYDFTGTVPFSVEAWIKPSDEYGQRRIVSKENGTPARQGWSVWTKDATLENGKYRVGFERFRDDGADLVQTAETLLPGRWAHVIASYDGNKMTIYVDGEQLAQTTGNTRALLNSSRPSQIGGSDWLDWDYFDGDIDEVAIYRRVLTEREAWEHYDAAVGDANTVAGEVTVRAEPTDDIGVTNVEFFADGTKFAEDTTAPYEVSWTTDDPARPVPDGVHHLTTNAYDGHNNVTTSAPLRVIVANAAGTKYRAKLAATEPMPDALQANASELQRIDVKVTNESNQTWPANALELRYRWVHATDPTVEGHQNVPLASALAPDGSTTIPIDVRPPTLPPGIVRSQYTLRIDLYDPAGGDRKWFTERGNKPLEHPVSVIAAAASELGLERYFQYEGADVGAGMQHLINVATGNSILRWTPFEAPGRGLATVVDLTYNSSEGASDSPVGNGWSLAVSSLARFGSKLDVTTNQALLTDGDGTVHRFEKALTGYYKEPPGVHLYLRDYSFTDLQRRWALTRPDRVTFFFDTDGYPTSVEDRNGNRLSFSYENRPADESAGPPKRVVEVTDAGGRSFTLDYYRNSATANWNLLSNPSFEASTAGWTGGTRVVSPSRVGSYALKLERAQGSGSGDVSATTIATVPSIGAYHATAYLRPTGEMRDAFIELTWLDAQGAPLGTASSSLREVGPRWTRVTLVTGVAPLNTASARIVVGVRGAAELEPHYLDGVTFASGTEVKRYTDADWPLATTTAMQGRLASLGDHTGSKLDFRYASDGNLTQIVQRGGTSVGGSSLADRSFTLDYAPATSRVTRLVDPRGNDTLFEYDAGGLLKKRLDRREGANPRPETELFYDPVGRVTHVDDPLDHRTSYGYDEDKKAVSITNAKGETTKLRWSRDRHVTKVIEPTGAFVEYAYDDNGYLTDQFDELRNHTRLEYEYVPVDLNDVAGKWAEGRTQPHISQLVRKTDPKGTATTNPSDDYQWQFAYDERGNLVTATDPLGYPTTVAYNDDGTVASETDPNRHMTRYSAYDANGLPRVVVEPNGSTTRFGYDDDGLLRFVQDPNHANYPTTTVPEPTHFRTELYYDSFHRLGRQSAPKSTSTESETGKLIWTAASYDANDNVVAENDPTYGTSFAAGAASSTEYDALDRPKKTTAPAHEALAAFVLASISQASSGTTITVNAATARWKELYVGRVVDIAPQSSGQPSASGTQRRITALNQGAGTISFDDGGGPLTVTTSDAVFEETVQTRKDGTTAPETAFAYDLASRLTETRRLGVAGTSEPSDFVTSYSYDVIDRVAAETVGAGLPQARTTNYCYDKAGDLRSITAPKAADHPDPGKRFTGCPEPYVHPNASHTTKLDYDAAHRLVSETQTLTDTTDTTRSMVYDANSDTVELIDGEGFRTRQSFNQRGELTEIKQPFEHNGAKTTRFVVSRFEYDPVGNLVREISPRAYDAAPDHRTEGFPWYVTSHEYDAADRLIRTRLPGDDALRPAWVHRAYDPNGNVLWSSLPVETPYAPAVLPEQKAQMTYFDPGWVQSVDEPVKGAVTFDYTAQGWQASRKAPATPLETWSYSSGGLVARNSDPNGDVNRFFYDIDGDLRTTNDSSGATSDDWRLRSQVSYNAFGEPLETRQFKRASGVWQQFRIDLASFDRNGNQATRTDDQGGAGERAHSFAYDQADRLISDFDDGIAANCADDQVVETTYLKNDWVSREEIRRRSSACEPSGWPVKQLTVSTYFDTGDPATRKTYAGVESPGNLVESHTLDYVDNGVYLNGHAEEDTFRLKGPNTAAPCRETDCEASYSYDGRDRLISWANGLPGANALSITYTLDPTTAGVDTLAGDVVREVVTAGTAPSQTTTTRDFSYGPGGQLLTLGVNGQPSERYFYGAQTGNLKCVTNDDIGGDPDPCALVNNQPKSFVRDWYKFDLLERLDRFVSKRGGLEVDTGYTYDAFDRIRSQTETRGSPTTSTFEYLGLSGAVSTESRADVTSAFSYDANGERVSISKSGATHTYARNPHGDISLLLGETGNATASYGYRPYGDKDSGLFAEPGHTETDPLNPYRFNDRRLDTGSGSIDMGARRYSPYVGRFLQQDFYRKAFGDIELSFDPLTQNRYAFAGGNPVSFVESDGHVFADPGGTSNRGTRDECTTVPDQIKFELKRVGIRDRWFDFREACSLHDACYGMWRSTRKRCDENFLEDMNRACDKRFRGRWNYPRKKRCLGIARVYHWGVWQYGGESWAMKAKRPDPMGLTGCPFLTRDRAGRVRLDNERCLQWVHERSYAPYYRSPEDTLRSIRRRIRDWIVPW